MLNGQPGQTVLVVVMAITEVLHGVVKTGGGGGCQVVVSSQGVVAGGVHFGQAKVFVVLSSQGVEDHLGHHSESARTVGMDAARTAAMIEVRILSSSNYRLL